MSISISLTEAPTTPQRTDPDNFRVLADQFVDWLANTFGDEMNTVITDFNATIQNLYVGTSTSSVAIGTGSKTFTMVESNLAFGVGTELRVAETADPTTNYMSGIVTAYNKTTKSLTVNVATTNGSGTISAWTMTMEPREDYNRVRTWSGMTGAASPPLTAYHSSKYWGLNTSLADVTAKEPGVDSEWYEILIHNAGDIKTVNKFDSNFTAPEWVECNGNLVDTGVYPELDSLEFHTTNSVTTLSDPVDLPTDNTYGVAVSPDGIYIAHATTDTPYILIYKRSGTTLTKLTDPATLPTGGGRGCCFDPTGTYLCVGHITSPFITIYKRSGDTFTKLSNPSSLPDTTGTHCKFDPTGTYLALRLSASPYLNIYKRSGDTFTKLPNPSGIDSTLASANLSWSPDSLYLAVPNYNVSPYLVIFKRSGDTFTELASPGFTLTQPVVSCAFSPDGNYLAASQTTGTKLLLFTYDADVFTSETIEQPTYNMDAGLTFSSDSNLLLGGKYTSQAALYRKVKGTFIEVDSGPFGTGGLVGIYDLAISPNVDFIYTALASGEFEWLSLTEKLQLPTLPISGDDRMVNKIRTTT